MCGIAGFLEKSGDAREALEARIGPMTEVLRHRGPDAAGIWVDPDAGVAFGHRRLAVIDLSAAASQPMVSRSGRYVVTYNGEIFNYAELRAQMSSDVSASADSRGHSDTAVLLDAVERWGIDGALKRFNGMFAFALWDRRSRTLDLVRDRVGEKPLYYGWGGGATFFFASELRAIRAYSGFHPCIDREALAQFVRHSYVPGAASIYQGIYKLPPGMRLTLDEPAIQRNGDGTLRPYWAPERLAAAADVASLPDEEAIDRLETLLGDSVRLRTIADVPLGACLSGGIDSSTIVALMARAGRRVNTFTIGFEKTEYDEAPHARAIARHLGTDHTELYVTDADALAIVPQLADIYDEPFADSSQIPTAVLSALVRSRVTVALSGEGGDELFGGYARYRWGDWTWRLTRLVPRGVRGPVAGMLMRMPRRAQEFLVVAASGAFSGSRLRAPGDKVQKFVAALKATRPHEWYTSLVSQTGDDLVLGVRAESLIERYANALDGSALLEREMFWDVMTYLPGDLLVKLDRAAMSVGLETRVPFLDHRIVEFAWRLPLSLKVRGHAGKWIVRQVLRRHLPASLADRPKKGFGVPLGEWLRGSLRPWADGLLDQARLQREGFLDAVAVNVKWREHSAGVADWSPQLWNILMFESWLENQSKTC